MPQRSERTWKLHHDYFEKAVAFCLATLIGATPGATWAGGEGHDHGDAPTAAAGSAQPRFTAVSDAFELVGVLNGKLLTLYLDRAVDNSPVKGATLELELGGVKVAVKPQGEGEFEATLAQTLAPGVTGITATVIAGQETDLLAGELDIRADVHAAVDSPLWQKLRTWLLAALLTLALLAWGLWRVRAQRGNRLGGAA